MRECTRLQERGEDDESSVHRVVLPFTSDSLFVHLWKVNSVRAFFLQSKSLGAKTPVQILEENRGSIAIIVAAGDTSVKLGTGFFVQSTGLLLTNFHVVEGTTIVGVKIPASDEIFLATKARGFDLKANLIALEVEAGGMKPVVLADSDVVRTGDQVVVVGNPEGLEQTVSNGLISGIRTVDGLKLLQISAPFLKEAAEAPSLTTEARWLV